MTSPTVELRPSARRTRTVTAYRRGDTVVVLVPARMSQAEQRRWAQRMVERITAKEQRRPKGDADLLRRARELAARYLPELAGLESLDELEVRWSTRQLSRWASCTPLDRTIRVSERLRGVPDWVLDDVLVHELAHLLEVNHSPQFWALAARHPRHAEAVTWLDGYAAGLAASAVSPPPLSHPRCDPRAVTPRLTPRCDPRAVTPRCDPRAVTPRCDPAL